MSEGRTGAQLLVDALEQYGVERVAGNPGTTELGVLDAIADSSLEYDLAPHEDVAVGMAAGYATVRRDHRHDDRRDHPGDHRAGADRAERGAATTRDAMHDANRDAMRDAVQDAVPDATCDGSRDQSWSTQPLGVANLHLLAGVAHGLGNLYDAWIAGAPVLVTAGTHARSVRHEEPILSGDLTRHVEPYTKWAAEVGDVDALPAMVRRAARTALTPPTGPTFLSIPTDVASASTDAEPEPLGPISRPGRGDVAALDAAAARLATAEDVVLLVGDGVARAGPDAVDAAVDLADALGARVHGEALSAAVSFPTDHELWASVLPPAEDAMRAHLDAGAVVLAGCTTNTTLVDHDEPLVPGETTLVHLGADPSQLGRRQPVDVALAGDPASLLDGLAERLADRVPDATKRERRTAAADRAATVREAARERTSGPASRSNGERDGRSGSGRHDERPADERPDGRPTAADLVEALDRVAPDALVVDEGISAKYALLARRDLDWGDFHSTKGGCLGYGLPAAVGAALAEADRADDAEPETGRADDAESETGRADDAEPETGRADDAESETGRADDAEPETDPRPVVGFVGDGSFSYYPQSIRAAVRADVDLTVVVANNGGYRSVAAKAEELLADDADPVGLEFDDRVDAAACADAHGATAHRVARRSELPDALSTAVAADCVALVDVRLAR